MTDQQQSEHVEEGRLADAWLSRLVDAAASADEGALAALFCPDGTWRDVLAYLPRQPVTLLCGLKLLTSVFELPLWGDEPGFEGRTGDADRGVAALAWGVGGKVDGSI